MLCFRKLRNLLGSDGKMWRLFHLITSYVPAELIKSTFQVEKTALECGEYAHVRTWHSALFTNNVQIFGKNTRLPDCGIFLTTKGELYFGPISEFASSNCSVLGSPSFILFTDEVVSIAFFQFYCFDTGSQPAVVELAKMLIPTVAIVDTDSDPRLVTYPVPGDDDTAETLEYYLGLFKEAILRGKERRKKDFEDEDEDLNE